MHRIPRISFALFAAVVFSTVFFVLPVHAVTLVEKFLGSILLQVESKGEAWYVDPLKKERWYLGRPADAFVVMRKQGIGMTDKNLLKIPRGDSDDRGDDRFAKRFYGRILLQVQSRGEAWYVYPKDGRRYFLGKPDDAFHMMRKLGLGITDTNLSTITVATGSASVVIAPLVVVAETSASDASPPASSPPSPLVIIRADMLALANGERRSGSFADLVLNDAVNASAQRLTDDMASRNYFAVKTPEGLGEKELLKEAGYEALAMGVLIAGGPQDVTTAFGLWNGGENSKAILVKPEYEDIGVGMTKGADGQNIWVIFFASSQVKYEQQISAALSDMEAMRQAMLTRVNQERNTNGGLPALVINPLLNESAQKKSEDMFTKDYFAHESPEGVTSHALITSTGYTARMSAENLAKEPKTVDEVMTGWMNSPGHRANILFDGIEEAGFGLKFGRNASGFHIFWTQHFGKR